MRVRPLEWFRGAWRWLNDSAGGIQAFTTVILALLAYVSWGEVRAQRQQVYEQLRLSNVPFIQIRAPEKIQELDQRLAGTNWAIENKGGHAEAVECDFVFFDSPTELPISIVRHVWFQSFKEGIASGDQNTRFMGFVEENRDWILRALEEREPIRLYGRVAYSVPPLVSGRRTRGEVRLNLVHVCKSDPTFIQLLNFGFQEATF